MTSLLDYRKQASEALKKAALNLEAKDYLLNNPLLFNLLLKAARRYIGGETLEEALETRKALQDQGFATSLEFMGESVHTADEAKEATREFLRLIEALKADNKPERVSLDLSHLGLFLDVKLGIDNFKLLANASRDSQIDLFISAEGVDKTQQILDTYLLFSQEYPHVSITLQTYLKRAKQDLARILKESHGKVRLVKGAYDGPQDQFVPHGPELNDRYIECMEILFESGRFCSIATHDPDILKRIIPLLDKQKIPSSKYEFEMLNGIGNNALSELKQQGHPARLYVVYGKEWYLYLCNRLSENPDAIFRALVDVLG
ncbi:MAG: proline dehydrogenase family protein [Parachlamydia sp.]|nr:proline dehydrogenase family protein [Parachlamydia sp.]